MKKLNIKNITIIYLTFLLSLVLFACQNQKPIEEAIDVQLDKKTERIVKYDVSTFEATIINGKDEDVVIWQISNEAVISITPLGNSVLLYAKSAGIAVLSAVINDMKVDANIIVIDEGVVPVIYSRYEVLEILEESYYRPEFTVTFYDNVYMDASYELSILDDGIAQIIDGRIYGLKPGETILTVKATWRGESMESLMISLPLIVKSASNT